MLGTTTVRASLEVPGSQRTSESLQKRSTHEFVHEPGSTTTCLSTDASEQAEEVTYENSFPEGGKGWVVVLGCFIYSAATIGWGCVPYLFAPWLQGSDGPSLYCYFPWGRAGEPGAYSLVRSVP